MPVTAGCCSGDDHVMFAEAPVPSRVATEGDGGGSSSWSTAWWSPTDGLVERHNYYLNVGLGRLVTHLDGQPGRLDAAVTGPVDVVTGAERRGDVTELAVRQRPAARLRSQRDS